MRKAWKPMKRPASSFWMMTPSVVGAWSKTAKEAGTSTSGTNVQGSVQPQTSPQNPASPQTQTSPQQSSGFASPEEEEAFLALHGGDAPFPSDEVPIQDTLVIETKQSKEESRLIGIEKIAILDEEGNEENIPLARYVLEDLSRDEIEFRSPLYASMLKECVSHVDDENFICSRFFRNNPNMEYSIEAVNLLSERYQLSKGQVMQSEEELASDYIGHMLLDYKFAIIDDITKQCQTALTNPEILKDADRSREILEQYMNLNETRKVLAKQLGDRVLIK